VTTTRFQIRRKHADPERKRLFSTVGYLIGTQGAAAILGLVYWPLSTHYFSPHDVGIAAAATSTANFLASMGVLGIATLLLAELRSVKPSAHGAIVSTGVLISGAVVLILSVGTLGLSPLLGRSLRDIGHDPATAALFVVGAIATVAAMTFDNVAIALRANRTRLIRTISASVLKLAIVGALILVGTKTTVGLVFAWSCGIVVSLVAGFRILRLKREPEESTLRARAALTRRYGMLSLNHHVLNLSISSVNFILPVVATLLVAPAEVAYFSTAQVLSSTICFVPYMLAFALFAETANDEALLHRLIRRTLPLGFASCIVIIVGVELGAPLFLRFFGTEYSVHGTTALRLLILGCLPYVVKDHYVAVRRAQRRLATGAKVLATVTAAETAAGALGGVLWGLNGLCAGWAVAAAVEALVLSPTVIRAYRRPPLTAEPRNGSSVGAV